MGSTVYRGGQYRDHDETATEYTSSRLPSPVPAKRKGFRGLPRWKKVLIVAGSALLAVALIAVGTAWALVGRYEGQVKHEDLLGDAAVPRNEQQQHFASGPINLLLLGSDSRAGTVDQNKVSGQRSDTIMLVHIAANRKQAAVISIPRDSFVDIPPGGSWSGGKNKINAAFAFGGAPLAAKTITQLTGVPLDGAMIADFAGIEKMVDAVGGVRVCINYDVQSTFSSRFWAKGCHQMNGAEAEEFVRQRKMVPGGDFGRMKDQQLVVQAIFTKVSSEGVLTNPLRLDRLLMTAAQTLTIDKSLNLRQLASVVMDIKPSAVRYATLPYTNPGLQTFAGSSVELDATKCASMFAAIRNDTIDQWIADNPSKPL